MDITQQQDGQFIAKSWTLPKDGPRFCLRLAHEHGYTKEQSRVLYLRKIVDFEWLIQTEGDNWLVIPEIKATILVPEGSVALIPPMLTHGLGRAPSQHIAVHFNFESPALSTDIELFDSPPANGIKFPFEASVLIRLTHRDEIYDLPLVQQVKDFANWRNRALKLIRILNIGKSTGLHPQLEVAQILAEMADEYIFSSTKHDPKNNESMVRNVLGNLDPSDKDIRIHELAKNCNMSQTLFRKITHAITGKSPSDWLEDLRFEKAKRLMQDPMLKINSIAMRCGYDDPYHFSRVFKRNSGVSPRAYRQKNLGIETHSGESDFSS